MDTHRVLEVEGATHALVLDVPMPFVSKSNFRRYAVRTRDDDWARYQSFERSLSAMARVVRPSDWPAIDGGVPLKARPVFVVSIFARTALDAANLPKSVLDALEGQLFFNDAQVLSCLARAERTRVNACGYVAVAALAPASSADVVRRAQIDLDERASLWWMDRRTVS